MDNTDKPESTNNDNDDFENVNDDDFKNDDDHFQNDDEQETEFYPPSTETIAKPDPFTLDDMKKFFNLTGGSLFYCLSAVFITYGIHNVITPILKNGKSISQALPCIFTLHVYELALLAVLILIVSRKVVDDAISVMVIIALFLVGTSMTLGAVINLNISAGMWIGLGSIVLAFGKFMAIRRFAKVPFTILTLVGLMLMVACNYLGPALLAHSFASEPTQELARRGLWMFLWLIVLAGAGIILIEAIRSNQSFEQQKNEKISFLQSPAMVYIFALILLSATAVHQYSISFTNTLYRAWGDYIPVIAMATLLGIELLRYFFNRFSYLHLAMACIPGAFILLGLEDKAFYSNGSFTLDLIAYPPVACGLIALAITALALYHHWYKLLYAVYPYGLGIILTAGFSPETPWDLNVHPCIVTMAVTLLAYGLVKRNQYVCIASIFVMCIDFVLMDNFAQFAKNNNLTVPGAVAGIAGLGTTILYLIFAKKLKKVFQIAGVIGLAIFILDWLPDQVDYRYAIASLSATVLITAFWLRLRDFIAIAILCAPLCIRFYIAARQLAHWRFIILGFLLLAGGAIASLKKRTPEDLNEGQRDEVTAPE